MRILKFGGSSVQTPERIRSVIKIIKNSQKIPSHIAVVVSAFGGVTDRLIAVANHAARGDTAYLKLLESIEKTHLEAVNNLIFTKEKKAVFAEVRNMLNELEDLLHGTFLIKEVTGRTLDFITSFGERLSAYIISQAFVSEKIPAQYLDARSLVKTDENFGNARVNFKETNNRIKAHFKKQLPLQIITGFIGSTDRSETTTLGRGGSDYSAAIFGAALDSQEIEIWTDVDGVMTADPRKVKKAFPIQEMTYEEAMEMSHFGAKVIHPPTMQPAMAKNIPLRIRNTFNAGFSGTRISQHRQAKNNLITGISSINQIALLRLEGGGLMGVVGMSMRLFGALARNGINVIMISQASSEHSICFAVIPAESDKAKRAIDQEFALEIRAGQIAEIIVEKELSIVAIVGENMCQRSGISGRLFQSLGKNGISAVAIAQGSSELNISVVINRQNEAKALNSIHDAFFLSDTKSIHLYIVGHGLIGGTLLKQIQLNAKKLQKIQQIELKVIAIADTRAALFNEEGISLDNWQKELIQSSENGDLKLLFKKIKAANLPNAIFIDCTASEEVIALYPQLLEASISIVTPNKKANSGLYKNYQHLKALAKKNNVKFLYETNVGAGLPIIGTLNDLVSSGDSIRKIEAVLSGTLSYIFNQFDGSLAFSAVVKEAKEKGFTEPDPRDDLSGLDVARKLLILGREIGIPLELKDIKVKNLLPLSCQKAKSVEAFFSELQKHDREFDKKVKTAHKQKKALRFIATLEDSQAEVGLQAVDRNHPFYHLSGNDNILAFTTERYNQTPLVVKGPGAGAEVTAAGVFADILRIANYLG